MKKDKLYTINRHNKNLFFFGGDSWSNLAEGAGMSVEDYQNSKNAFGISKLDNPFSKGNINGTMKSIGTAGAMMASSIGANEQYKRGLYDIADPMYHIAGGRESTVGNALSDAGVSLFQSGVSSGNPWLMLAGAGAKIGGGLYNASFGHAENKGTINAVNALNTQNIALNGIAAQANTNDEVLQAASMMNGGFDISKQGFKNGWFNKAGDKAYNQLVASQEAAQQMAAHGLMAGAQKADQTQDDMVAQSFFALGGDMPSYQRHYSVGDTIEVSEEQANNLKRKGYEFRIVG